MPSETVALSLPRPAERVAIVSLVLVFLCGIGVGAVGMSFSGHRLLHASSHSVSAGPPSMSIAEWKSELGLSDEQTVQLTSILDDFARYYDNVLADGNSRIVQILNPEQRRRFDRLLRDHNPQYGKP